MKNIILILCSVVLFSCSKDAAGPDMSVSGSGSIEYKVNGTLFKMDNANIANGEGVAFAKQLKGSFLANTRYALNAQKERITFLRSQSQRIVYKNNRTILIVR